MKVRELMKQPIAIDEDMTLKEAAKIMGDKRIGSLFFMKEGKLEGIVTERDLLKNYDQNKMVSEAMSKGVITIEEGEDVSVALKLMNEKKVKRLAVLDDNKLVGIISVTDIAGNAEHIDEAVFFD